MKCKFLGLLTVLFVLTSAGLLRADDPTSKFVSLAPISTTLAPGGAAVAVQFEIWDRALSGTMTMISTEAHTVDTDAGSNINNDTGFPDLLLGRPGGLIAANFPAGSSRYLDVTQGGVSVLAGRIPLYASPFSVAPGPQGPAGPAGPTGPQGPQGPPGVVQAVTPGDYSIAVAGTPTNPTVFVARITNSQIDNFALSPMKVAGIAATQGPNNFVGDQATNGNLSATGNLALGGQHSEGECSFHSQFRHG